MKIGELWCEQNLYAPNANGDAEWLVMQHSAEGENDTLYACAPDFATACQIVTDHNARLSWAERANRAEAELAAARAELATANALLSEAVGGADAVDTELRHLYEQQAQQNAVIDALRTELAAARAERKLWQVSVYDQGAGCPVASVTFDTREVAQAAYEAVEEDEFQWVVLTEHTLNDASALKPFMKVDEEGN